MLSRYSLRLFSVCMNEKGHRVNSQCTGYALESSKGDISLCTLDRANVSPMETSS